MAYGVEVLMLELGFWRIRALWYIHDPGGTCRHDYTDFYSRVGA